jgi:hypothetical protein
MYVIAWWCWVLKCIINTVQYSKPSVIRLWFIRMMDIPDRNMRNERFCSKLSVHFLDKWDLGTRCLRARGLSTLRILLNFPGIFVFFFYGHILSIKPDCRLTWATFPPYLFWISNIYFLFSWWRKTCVAEKRPVICWIVDLCGTHLFGLSSQ